MEIDVLIFEEDSLILFLISCLDTNFHFGLVDALKLFYFSNLEKIRLFYLPKKNSNFFFFCYCSTHSSSEFCRKSSFFESDLFWFFHFGIWRFECFINKNCSSRLSFSILNLNGCIMEKGGVRSIAKILMSSNIKVFGLSEGSEDYWWFYWIWWTFKTCWILIFHLCQSVEIKNILENILVRPPKTTQLEIGCSFAPCLSNRMFH